ncbi:hypothetical protein LRS13_22085 [Svornostia abyssi]|uniref:Uncharacterized protein n=1 Tax=Svornostia abyssi TaxID=2898438 RepID=A0ABY5PF71_9ACTN|nr:hypothetical protein LRS13_22085 [Parviterribacteraceae bacterium J379]
MTPDHASADALVAAIAEADRRTAATTADALRARPAAEPDRLPSSLRDVGAATRDALVLLELVGKDPLGGPAARMALQSTARALDVASLILGDSAVRARGAGRDTAGDGDIALARHRLVHVLEQQEADITHQLRDIEGFALTIRRLRLNVDALPPTRGLPEETRAIVTGLDVNGRVASLRTAVASSHRTVPNLVTLRRDGALPMSLDVHARAIEASAETARLIDGLLDLRGAVAARWPDVV